VWRATTQLGCALQACSWGSLVVCRCGCWLLGATQFTGATQPYSHIGPHAGFMIADCCTLSRAMCPSAAGIPHEATWRTHSAATYCPARPPPLNQTPQPQPHLDPSLPHPHPPLQSPLFQVATQACLAMVSFLKATLPGGSQQVPTSQDLHMHCTVIVHVHNYCQGSGRQSLGSVRCSASANIRCCSRACLA